MEIKKSDKEITVSLSSVEEGAVFRYPAGKTVYMVCNPVGNLDNLYSVGKSSKKRKVWATNLANGNVSAIDEDKQVVLCRASMTYSD